VGVVPRDLLERARLRPSRILGKHWEITSSWLTALKVWITSPWGACTVA